MKKMAIVGSGISGIMSAYLLKDHFEVTLFESRKTFGGHSHTVTLTLDHQTFPVDTGFIVCNDRTYPHILAFFELLGVSLDNSNMSFAVTLSNGELEYCGSSIGQFFAQKENLFKKSFWRMGLDVLRFNKQASALDLETLGPITLEDYLDQLGLSDVFRESYLYPMAGAIWSAPADAIGAFPASSFLRFFKNHGLLTVTDHPQWYTVSGGSIEYVKRALTSPRLKKVLETPVEGVKRVQEGVQLSFKGQPDQLFESVILATPADITHRLLQDKSEEEDRILGAFQYTKNRVYLHSDPRLMPKRRKAWASWNYFTTPERHVGVTYWMNLLQKLPTEQPVFVTLNPVNPPSPQQTYREMTYYHPLFNQAALEAQKKIPSLQGRGGLYFAGSYQDYGFHEDGARAALRVVNQLGIQAPWQ